MARRGRASPWSPGRALTRPDGRLLQGSWTLGFLIAAVLYATIYGYVGWRGMLWLGILPAFAVDLDPLLREGAGSLGQEPEDPATDRSSRQGPAARHLQARRSGEHAHRLLLDGQRLHRLLLDLCAVRDAYDPRSASFGGTGRVDAGSLKRIDLPGELPVGHHRRQVRPTLGDDHSGDPRFCGHAVLSGQHRYLAHHASLLNPKVCSRAPSTGRIQAI